MTLDTIARAAGLGFLPVQHEQLRLHRAEGASRSSGREGVRVAVCRNPKFGRSWHGEACGIGPPEDKSS